MIIEDENGRTWTTDELRDREREPDEPEPAPPVDLDQVEADYRAYLGGAADVESMQVRDLLAYLRVFDAVPDLIAELRAARAELARRDALPTRTEWAVTSGLDTPPWDRPGTRWFGCPGEAQRAYGRGGQMWMRTVTFDEIEPCSEPPF